MTRRSALRAFSPRPFAATMLCALLLASRAMAADGGSVMRPGTHNLADLDLDALMNVEFTSAAGLTDTTWRHLPASMTELDSRDITRSGARDLNHLLEAYVPNVQFLDHHHLQGHLGIRGIISDREDKYLYQVNGRTMNNHTLLGADNERAFPLLGDIRAINVVRGPASATHGAGAVAGVIDAETFTGLTFQGADVQWRRSFEDRYSAAEVRYGRAFSEYSGLFVYYGVVDQDGADSDYFIGHSYPATNGLPANTAGEPYTGPKSNLGEAGFGQLWHKFHFSYTSGPFELWIRYVQDGAQDRPMREIYTLAKPATETVDEWTRGRQFRNQQLTGTLTFRKELTPQWNLEVVQSADGWNWKDQRAGVYDLPIRNGREREYVARAVAIWTPNDEHSLAFGSDYSREWFHNPPYSDTLDRVPVVTDRDWATNRLSFLAEHQWKLDRFWTTFLSVRTDKHTFTGWVWSPRATVVFTPADNDTLKLIVGESARRGGDEELWAEWERNHTIPKPESLRSYELSYEHKFSERWSATGNVFVETYDAIGWIPSLYYSSSIGRYSMRGAEFELSYTSRTTRLNFSHGITVLGNAVLPASLPMGGQAITAEPYGYGNDLAEWAPHISKLAIVRDLTPRWTVSGSVVYYSGFPGAEDYARYAATFPVPPSAMPVSDPGYTDPYGANLFVNAGLEYRPNKNWTIRLDASNLAALADPKLSKRNYYFRFSEFSVQPASLSFSVRCGF